MIWTYERYKPCLDALEADGLLEWRDENGYYWKLDAYYPMATVMGGDECHVLTAYEASALLEGAARKWLDFRGVYVCPRFTVGGFHGYAAYRIEGTDAILDGKIPWIKQLRFIDGRYFALRHVEAQAETMLDVLSGEE